MINILDSDIDILDRFLEPLDIVFEDLRIFVDGIISDEAIDFVEFGGDRFRAELAHCDPALMLMVLDALDGVAHEGRFASGVLALENVLLAMLRAQDLLGDPLDARFFLYTLYFGTHKLFMKALNLRIFIFIHI